MKKWLMPSLFCVVSFIVVFSGCKKDDSAPVAPAPPATKEETIDNQKVGEVPGT